ncbi:MAG: nucleoside 2-deoxyribosyltransferase [Sulfurimonas sp.]|uniref:nucleoside 2-deoxyribosyltransferase n=1 Tax=Sulfurimonas sp. TaxID=2022749 RepID=UPI0026260151|nr:nucleoside 2-deoxyribosyltransferase [Sulfurimonas sp.]MDD5372342.1 nucleoside 2-deoxyribosyltransferase [Sulfurimonas sp.]
MTVYGGYYREQCLLPSWDNYYGSAGRAVAVLSNLEKNIIFETYVANDLLDHIQYFKKYYDINLKTHQSDFLIDFSYFHSLSKPIITSNIDYSINKNEAIIIQDKYVICYGTLESKAPVIRAEKCVFDFQSSKLEDVYNNGNMINEVCLIMNFEEASSITNSENIIEIKKYLFTQIKSLKILVLKDGPFGGYVFYENSQNLQIPIFKTDKLFKIGTGDIFTAIFGYLWINQEKNKLSIQDITEQSAFSTAYFGENFFDYKINILDKYKENLFRKVYLEKINISKKVYLAGPFFNSAQRWQLEDIKQLLENFKFNVFSPLHNVGTSKNSRYIATKDLEALDNSDIVFAILNDFDTGTIFEIGYAMAKEKQIIVFVENYNKNDLTMIEGSGCLIYTDLTTAIYNLVWTSLNE